MSDQTPVGSSPDGASLHGRVAIVTGGTRGIGRVIAEHLLSAGASVMVCARRAPETPIVSDTRTAAFQAADVREPDQVQAVVDAAIHAFGRLDILVNNAGGAPPSDSATASASFNEKIIALNLLGPITFAQAFYRAVADQPAPTESDRPVIVNISSVSGHRPNPGGVAYGAAKAGLDNATQTLAHEWGPTVRVVGITAGMVLTEDARAFYGSDEQVARIGDLLAAGRMGTPDDIAAAVLMLVSPGAAWITGTNLAVHGGDEGPSYLRTLS